MSNSQPPSYQNDVPRYPPGLPTTPGSPVVLQPATQTPPPIQHDANEQARAGDVVAFMANLTPMVINDTFDSVDYDQAPDLSPPPLTQRPRSDHPLVEGTGAPALGRGPTGTGIQNASQAFVYPAAQDATAAASNGLLPPISLDRSRSQWGSTQTAYDSTPLHYSFTSSEAESASASPRAQLSPSPTIRAARVRSQALVCHPSAHIDAENQGQAGQQAANAGAAVAPTANQGDISDSGTDYFAYYPTPPIIDPPYYTEHVLQGATHMNDPDTGTGHDDRPGGPRFARQLLMDGDPGARFRGEHQPNSPHTEHTGNPRKRLWPGSPSPEEVQRGLGRPRPANTTPALRSGRGPLALEDDLANPWESAGREGAPARADGLSSLGLAFAPVTASTPAQSVHNLTDPPPMARPVPSTTSILTHTQPSARLTDGNVHGISHPPTRDSANHGDANDAPMDTDDRDRSPEPHSQDPKPDKGKGKARALPQASDDEEEAADPPITNGGGWSEAEILEARERSLRQALEDRAGAGRGAFTARAPQSNGAGPSGHRSGRAAEDERDWRPRDDLPSRPPPRGESMTPRGPRYDRSGPGEPERSQWGGYDSHHTAQRHRERSAFAPLPNTRAAQYMADNAPTPRRGTSPLLPQRSPFSRISNLQNANPYPAHSSRYRQRSQPYGENIPPSPAPRPWENYRDEEMLDDEGAVQNSNRRTYEDWDEEDGELLPSALREDHDGARLEPTDVPEGGFPSIHRDDPEADLRGMAREWVREVWSDPANSAILLDVFNYQYTEDDALNRRIEENIRRGMEYISGETDFDVVPPELEDGVRARARDLPRIWAVRNLSPDGVARALARRTWSFPYISFLTSPRSTTMTRWVMMLEGFLNDNTNNIRAAVFRVLEEPEMMKWMRRMVTANPDFAGWPVDEAVTAVLRTLRVETLRQGNGNYVTNVFIRSPTRDLREWRRWVARLRTRRYRSFANGTGRVRYIAACPGCRSVSHPMHLCPFPRIRGWNGPEPGQGVFGERAQTDDDGQAGAPHGRRGDSGSRAPSNTSSRSRRGTPRREDRSSHPSGSSGRGKDGRGPRPGKGAGGGSRKKGY